MLGRNASKRHRNRCDDPRQTGKQTGQTIIEYAILLTLVILAAGVSLTSLGDDLKKGLEGLDWGGGDDGDGNGSEVLVVRVVDAGQAGIGDVRVYAYTDQGAYLEEFKQTSHNGDALFGLGDGRYQFLAQHQLQWFWSDVAVRPGQSSVKINTGQAPFRVTVIDIAGNGLPDLPVYVFTEEDEYIGVEGRTNENGEVTLGLVENDVKFRVDHNGQAHWSGVVATSDDELTITLNSCATGQFLAEYFNNRDLSGDPILTRCESEIDNDWGSDGPGEGVDANNFSVRWTGYQSFEEGTYAFRATADDGVRVWVDGQMLTDAWRDQAATTYRARQSLESGEHAIKMEYYERWGQAVAKLRWEEAITSCPTGQFMAEYFNNRNLSGDPAVVRCENMINNDWGGDQPVDGIGSNNFSIRWTGKFQFEEGTYAITATADDGVRVWADNRLIIDAWRPQSATAYGARQVFDSGEHEIRMAYYEQGGNAVANLRWTEATVSCPDGQFLAEYYNNINLGGDPVVSQCEREIDYDWGNDGPNGINSDYFSVRWTGTFQFEGGETEFEAKTDDGMQVFVDNALIISAWQDQGATEYKAKRDLSGGEHEIRVNYYERGGHAVAKVDWD